MALFNSKIKVLNNLIWRHKIFILHEMGALGPLLDDSEKSVETHRLIIIIHEHRIKPIVTICELNDMLSAHSYSLIVLDREIFEGFHESSLHVASVSCFYCCIYETFSSTDCMEEEFGRSKTTVKTVGDKPFCCWLFGIWIEMRKGSVEKAIWHSQTINCLLTYTGDHLT